MKKSFLVSLVAFFAIVTIIFFGSCADLADSSQALDNSPSVQDGRAILSFSINAENARTITPSNLALTDIKKITLQTEKMNEKGAYEVIKKAEETFWETNDTKTAYELLTAEKFVFDYGTYNLYLELYAVSPYGDCASHVVQTAELKDLAINEKTENLEFESKFVEAGAVFLVFQLDAIEGLASHLGTAEVTLHKVAEDGSIGELVTDTYQSYLFDEDNLAEIESDSGTKSVYQLNYILGDPIPNGDYWYKLLIYDKDDNKIVIKQKADIVRIKGYKTEKTIVLDPAEINAIYSVTYKLDSDDATWADGSNEDLVVRRNAYEALTLPTSDDVSRSGYKIAGWTLENSQEVLKEIEAGEDSASDYVLYAKWIEDDAYALNYNNIDGISETIEIDSFKEDEDVTLPTVSRTYYTFGGWYTDKDCTEGKEITGWKAGERKDDVTVWAKWTLVPNIYVTSSGSDENDGTTETKALDSIAHAVDVISILAEKDADWTIYVSGEVKGEQNVGSGLNGCAKSLTITGLSDNSSEFKDIFDAKLSEVDSGIAFTVNSNVPVTVSNLKITGGTHSAIAIYGGTLVMKDCAVSGNDLSSSSTGVVEVYNDEAKFFMYGSSVIGDKSATELATDSSFSNKCYSALYINYGNAYLGYKPDSDGNPEAAELSGGIFGNYYSGTLIYAGAGSLYMNSGTIKYNSGDTGSSLVDRDSLTTVVISGGSIENNSGKILINGSATNDSEVQPFILKGTVSIDATLYSQNNGIITIGSNFKSENVIALECESYEEGRTVLAADDGVTLTEAIISKFALVQPDDGKVWGITTDGKLEKLVAKPAFQITLESVKSDDTGIVSLSVDGTAVTATIAEGYSVYSWVVDDDSDVSTETETELDLLNAAAGSHNVTVVVVGKDSEDYYSATAVVKITKD